MSYYGKVPGLDLSSSTTTMSYNKLSTPPFSNKPTEKNNTQGDIDDSDTSSLEEGEIVEENIPPPSANKVPLHKPTPIQPSRQRFRQPPPPEPRQSSSPPHRVAYPPLPPHEDFERPRLPPKEYNPTSSQIQDYPIVYEQEFQKTAYYNSSQQHYSYPTDKPFIRDALYRPSPKPADVPKQDHPPKTQEHNTSTTDTESAVAKGAEYLQSILSMGLTYDELLAQGMHPLFLDQLFSRLNQQPQPSEPQPQPQTQIPLSQRISSASVPARPSSTDIDAFLSGLEPSIPPPTNGTKKRHFLADSTPQAPKQPKKRRAFGIDNHPQELVIDVSDDDEDSPLSERPDPHSERHSLGTNTPLEETGRSSPHSVTIPADRPGLTQKDVVTALRSRELAIEAMKRKIEAKMRQSQGPNISSNTSSSTSAIAQKLATTIVDNGQSFTPTPTLSPKEGTPAPHESAAVEMEICAEGEEDEEESRLLAELEAERQAEEKARLKRRELEERLAIAKKKKDFQLSRDASPAVVMGGEKNALDVQQDKYPGANDDVEMLVRHEDEYPMRIDTPEIAIVNDASEDADAVTTVDSSAKLPTRVKEVVKDTRYIYFSPLKVFRSFRFHPLFLHFVPQYGFRSHTYSNNIQPQLTLCPYELSGGLCNDSHCQHQHYKTIFLSDPEIIRDMMQDIITSSEEDQQLTLRNDLHEMLKQVHSQSHGDFQTLALSVVQFRNSRLADKLHFIDLS